MTDDDVAAVDPTRRKRAFLTGLVVGAVVVGGGGLAAAHLIKSPAQLAAEAAPPPTSRITVPIERRVLRNTVILRGTVTPSRAIEVTPTASQTGGRLVLTGMRVRAGATIKTGQVLAEVSGRPVFALPGAVPAFRDLRPGAQGSDVAQLQAALRAVGHPATGDTSGTFGPATKDALTAWYAQIGYPAIPTGENDDQQLSSARLQLRQAGRALDSAKRAASAAQAAQPADPEAVAAAADTLAGARDSYLQASRDLAELQRRTGPILPMDEVAYVPRFPARVTRVNASIGAPVTGAILVLSSGELVVRSTLLPSDQSLVRTGQQVEITSEVVGSTVGGVVATVGQQPDTGQDSGGQDSAGQGGGDGQGGGGVGNPANPGIGVPGSGFPITVRGTKPLDPDLTGQDVRLTIVAASTKGPVFVVPLAAITTRADGQTRISVVDGDGAETWVVVRVGTSGGGYAEVTPVGGTLVAGTPVVVGR